MSGAIKGYESKEHPRNFEYATVENLNGNQLGLTTSSTVFYENTGSDLTEASSVAKQIIATAHAARVGDIVRVTSGVNSGYSKRATSVDTNNIFFLDAFPLDFGIGDSFDILRPTVPTVDQLGGAIIAGAYAEDSPHTSGDTMISVIGVRNDTNAVMSSTDGDYTPLTTDNTGRLRVDATISEQATVADGGALPAVVKVIAGYDGAAVQVVHTDATGDIQVDLASSIPAGTNNIGDVDVLTEPATSADASAGLPAVSKVIAGYDGTNIRTIHTDATGDIQVDIASSIPAGANNIGDVDVLTEPATVANGGALPAVVKVMAGYDGANVQVVHTDASGDVQVDLASALPAGTNNIGDVDVLTEPATAADGGALPATTKVISGYDGANVQVIHTDATGDIQVDLASSIPAGTNNIGDVDVLSLPGALTGYAEDSAHVSGDIGVLGLAVRNDAGSVLAGTTGDYIPLSTDSSGNLRTQVGSIAGKSKVNLIRNDYSSTNVTTAAYVQLVASTSAVINRLSVFDSSGETLVFAVGAAASEVNQFYIFPGGNGDVDLTIPAGSRLSVKAVSATASTGELDINTFS
jgi:hypothetical protein